MSLSNNVDYGQGNRAYEVISFRLMEKYLIDLDFSFGINYQAFDPWLKAEQMNHLFVAI